MKIKWNEKSTADKVMLILRLVISVVVFACAILQLCGVWNKALNIAVPLLSTLILIQSIQEQKENKKISAVIGYVCFVAMLIMIIVSKKRKSFMTKFPKSLKFET